MTTEKKDLEAEAEAKRKKMEEEEAKRIAKEEEEKRMRVGKNRSLVRKIACNPVVPVSIQIVEWKRSFPVKEFLAFLTSNI